MWLWVGLFVLWFVFWSSTESQPSESGYKTKYFGPDSLKTYTLMKQNGLSSTSLRDFLMLEDQFLGYERDTVCRGVSRLRNAVALSRQMRELFPGYDFTYHDDIHIKQMDTPSRVLNRNLVCF